MSYEACVDAFECDMATLTLYFVMYLLPVVLFVALAIESERARTPSVDTAVLEAIHGYASPTNDRIATLVTNLGDDMGWGWRRCCLSFGCGAKRYRDVLVTAVGIGGSAVINVVLKAVFQRDRPQLWQRIITENGHSFPVVMLWHRPRWRLSWCCCCGRRAGAGWAVGGAATYAMAIGLSRLYLGIALSVRCYRRLVGGWRMGAGDSRCYWHWRFRRS